MRYNRLPAQLFADNRKKFAALMEPGSLAVFNSNDIYPTSADGTMPFKQHADIFYLSGVDQEESILVIFPECSNPKHREVLFLRKTNETIAIWEGEKLTKEAALDVSGIKTVYWLEDFTRVFNSLMAEARAVYLNTNEHLRANNPVQTREDRFIVQCKNDYPAHTWLRAAPLLHTIRSVKEEAEIAVIKHACGITEKGFRRLLGFVKPGVWEFEIEAELMHEFLRNRSRGFAYTPIIASGPSACVLHYIENSKQCLDGHMLLLDVGAEYGNYASDMTRCIPVNGRFSERQKAVYNAVLRVKDKATALLRPGVMMQDYHAEVGRIMEAELVGLGMISQQDIANQDPEWPAYKKYFMHGTSHFLGLDVHDVGHWHKPIQKGMVFTVEPGIYIPEEGLGIRLEDNIVVTDGDPVNLMANIPLQAEEIEELMHAR
jgi:Xaa-Pro aminopeptidase